MTISLNIKGFLLMNATPSKFGNGAHILIPKKYQNKKFKIIAGKEIFIKNNKINLDIFGNEIFERTPTTFGTSYHIIVPKEYLNKKINLIVQNEK